jgi:probable F420-dependent oxidoreductase
MDLGKFGVRFVSDLQTADQAASAVQNAEKLGYGAVWVPEAMGRNALIHAAWLLSKSSKIKVGTSIANIYGRDPMAMAGAQYALNEQWGDRFLLGVGVSHAPLVEGARQHTYDKPVSTMRAYLEAMSQVQYQAPPPKEKPKTIVAALGPKMLEVAGKYADGACPLFTTAQHTADARKILGPGKLLVTEMLIILEKDATKARELGRQHLKMFLALDNYRNSVIRQGFSASEVDSMADRMIDELVAWGPLEKIRDTIQKFVAAGSDHTVIHPLPAGTGDAAPDKVLALLAPGK